jgi:hypothetical protein
MAEEEEEDLCDLTEDGGYDHCRAKMDDMETFSKGDLLKWEQWSTKDWDQTYKDQAKQLYDEGKVKYCNHDKLGRYEDTISWGDVKCYDLDTDNSIRRDFCLLEDEYRLENNHNLCRRSAVGDTLYEEMATTYCEAEGNHKNWWCGCYNVLHPTKCSDNPNAATCPMVSIDPLLADEDAIGQEGYDILVNNKHCRKRVCEADQFVPKSMPACPKSVTICDNVYNLKESSTSDVIRGCVDTDFPEIDWEQWNEQEIPPMPQWMIDRRKKDDDSGVAEDPVMMITLIVIAFCLLIVIGAIVYFSV